jgi:hypothetical protein
MEIMQTMDQCINPTESLVDLYRARNTIKAKIKINKLLGDKEILKALGQEYKEINTKIKKVEDIGLNGGGIIRLM